MQWAIGLDWGTSSLRAMLFDAHGTLRETRRRPWGIRHLPEGSFDAALMDICAGWPSCPVFACGMVGSRQGWREAPYADAPADLEMLVARLTPVRTADGRKVWLVPGVRDASGPDVMRGEETQVMGALDAYPALAEDGQLVLPGTHSKWVDVRAGRIFQFFTMMTGEIYAVLREHSILGAGVPVASAQDECAQAFEDGVSAARASGSAGALTRIFSTRALMLESRLEAAAVPDYLSGLMIGEEWRSMLASGWLRADRSPALVGDAALCARYGRAATLFDLPPPRVITDASERGLWQIIAATLTRDTRADPVFDTGL